MFLGKSIIIVTDQGDISLKADLDSNFISKLNEKLKNFKIESANDFSKLKNNLKELDQEKYSEIERALFNKIKSPWRFFNPASSQVPRPMNVVLNKTVGANSFVVFSLNAKNFSGALDSNRHVTDYVAKKIKNPDEMKEEDILMIIKEGIDNTLELVDFELRVGIIFNNYSNGKYNYSDNSLNDQEQYEYVSKLIEKYGISYVENPFAENNLEMYKKLADNYRHMCLICMNSKINEYSRGLEKKSFNTVVVKFIYIASFKVDVDFFNSKGLNLVVDGRNSVADLAVGLRIPLVKIMDDKNGEQVARRLALIAEEIVANKSERK